MRITKRRIKQIQEAADDLPSESAKFENLLSRLSENQKRELLAVVYLGRGDFSSWESAFANTTLPNNIADYLTGKTDVADYMSRGWDAVPRRTKANVVNDAVEKLNKMIEALKEVLDSLEGYLIDFRDRPEPVASNLLRLSSYSDEIRTGIEKNPRVTDGWYYEKSETMQISIKRAIAVWIRDHEKVEVSGSSPLSSDQWIREVLSGSLRGSLKMARVLRQALDEDKIDILDYRS